MRLKYYKLTLRQMGFQKLFVFFLIIFVIFFILVYILNKNIEPTIKALCESNARMIALRASNKGTYDYIKDIKYENLITMQKDSNGKVTALIANAMEINKLSNIVTSNIQTEIEKYEESQVTFPLGSIAGLKFLGGYGPKFKIKTLPAGDVSVDLKSSFEEAGINQTKHSIIVEVSVEVKILAPFYTDSKTYKNEIIVAETIIVGDTPSSYYNIDGIENLETKDTLDLIK